MRSMPMRLALLSLLITIGMIAAKAQGDNTPPAKKTGSTKDTSKKTGTTNQTVYNPGDVIAQKVQGSHLFDASDVPNVLEVFRTFLTNQSNGDALLDAVASASSIPSRRTLSNKVVVIAHVVLWKSSPSGYQPTQGAWAFYRSDKGKHLHQDFDLSGTPYLYNPSNVTLVDLNYFDDKFDDNKATIDYSITTNPRQKQNASDLATLASALLKVTPSQGIAAVGTKKTPQVWGTFTSVRATSPLPYDLAIKVTINDKENTVTKDATKGKADAVEGVKQADDSQVGGQQSIVEQDPGQKDGPAAGTDSGEVANKKTTYASCDPSPCSFSRTVTAYDPEYWDVSLGITIPGVLENVYSSTTTPGTVPKSTPSRHTDAYAFVDIYAFQYWAKAPSTLSYAPHFNFGVPITSQSLHRPYVGMAENLSFLTKLVRLNIPLAVYAGPVFMKQQVYDTSTSSLKWDHAIKGLYGLELPISAITKYMKSGSKGSNNSKSSDSSNGGGS